MSEENVETQEQPVETAPETSQPSDPWAFYNAEHIPEEHRENYNKGFQAVRSEYDRYRKLTEIPGFDKFLDRDDIPDFETLIQAFEKGKVPQNGRPAEPVKQPEKPAPAAASEDPRIQAMWEQHQQTMAQQKVANLLNTYPEAKELLKDPEVREQMKALTGGDEPLPLEAAYALATREAYAAMKLKGTSVKQPPQPEGGGKTGSEPARKGPRDIDAILDDLLARSNIQND